MVVTSVGSDAGGEYGENGEEEEGSEQRSGAKGGHDADVLGVDHVRKM